MSAIPSLEDIITAIVLITPGFITLTIIKDLGILERKLTDFENTITSIFLSLSTYVLYSYLTGIDFSEIQNVIFQPLHYILLYLISIILGFFIVFLGKLISPKQILSGDVWVYIQDNFKEKISFVNIYTKNGLEYKGILHFAGRKEVPRDLVIMNPKLILRDESWNILDEIEMGKDLYFREDDISRIIFYDEIT